jgi:hypothetical protein
MASEVDICNLALAYIGGGAISSLNNPVTKEQKLCKLFYEFARNSVLEDNDWGFARKQLTLALLPETYGAWSYAYQYPSDCIVAREIYDSTNKPGESEVEFEVVTNSDKNKQVILTNQAEAILVYTAKVTDPNLFSSMFIDALSLRMAATLAIPLKGKEATKQSALVDYGRAINRAQVNNRNQKYNLASTESSFSKARL